MEPKSLFLGLTFTIGVFALKSGVGLHYFFTQRHSLKGQILLSIGSALAYFFIFFISYLILKKINVIDYYNAFQGLFRSGMYILFYSIKRRWVEEDIKNIELATEILANKT